MAITFTHASPHSSSSAAKSSAATAASAAKSHAGSGQTTAASESDAAFSGIEGLFSQLLEAGVESLQETSEIDPDALASSLLKKKTKKTSGEEEALFVSSGTPSLLQTNPLLEKTQLTSQTKTHSGHARSWLRSSEDAKSLAQNVAQQILQKSELGPSRFSNEVHTLSLDSIQAETSLAMSAQNTQKTMGRRFEGQNNRAVNFAAQQKNLPSEIPVQAYLTKNEETNIPSVDFFLHQVSTGRSVAGQSGLPFEQQNLSNFSASTQTALNGMNASVVKETVPESVHAPDWSEAISQRVLSAAAAKTQQLELELNPLHLGPLRVHINLEGEEGANVTFYSKYDSVRDTLQNALPQLSEMFSNNGLTLQNAQVSPDFSQKQDQPSDRGFAQTAQQFTQQEQAFSNQAGFFGAFSQEGGDQSRRPFSQGGMTTKQESVPDPSIQKSRASDEGGLNLFI